MAKNSPMLQKIEAKHHAYYAALFHARLDMAMQIVQDAACFAAHDVFQMGAGRAPEFCASLRTYTNEMAHFIRDDQDDDRTFQYSKAKIDENLKKIVGEENFVPWSVRYGMED